MNKAHFPLLIKPNVIFVLFTDVSSLSLLSKNLLISYMSLRYFGLLWESFAQRNPRKKSTRSNFCNISIYLFGHDALVWV